MDEAEIEQKAEEEHQKLVGEVKNYSQEIEDKYDEKMKKLAPIEEEENEKIAELNSDYMELKEKITAARKAGKDMFFAHQVIMSFPSKLAMARATGSSEDLKKAENILKEASKEIEEGIHADQINFRKDVEKRVQELLALEVPKEDEK